MTGRATLSLRFAPAEPQPHVDRTPGAWLIYRKVPRGFTTGVGGRRMPRFRHDTFENAQSEAERLVRLHPESTFVILQEVARVVMQPAEVA